MKKRIAAFILTLTMLAGSLGDFAPGRRFYAYAEGETTPAAIGEAEGLNTPDAGEENPSTDPSGEEGNDSTEEENPAEDSRETKESVPDGEEKSDDETGPAAGDEGDGEADEEEKNDDEAGQTEDGEPADGETLNGESDPTTDDEGDEEDKNDDEAGRTEDGEPADGEVQNGESDPAEDGELNEEENNDDEAGKTDDGKPADGETLNGESDPAEDGEPNEEENNDDEAGKTDDGEPADGETLNSENDPAADEEPNEEGNNDDEAGKTEDGEPADRETLNGENDPAADEEPNEEGNNDDEAGKTEDGEPADGEALNGESDPAADGELNEEENIDDETSPTADGEPAEGEDDPAEGGLTGDEKPESGEVSKGEGSPEEEPETEGKTPVSPVLMRAMYTAPAAVTQAQDPETEPQQAQLSETEPQQGQVPAPEQETAEEPQASVEAPAPVQETIEQPQAPAEVPAPVQETTEQPQTSEEALVPAEETTEQPQAPAEVPAPVQETAAQPQASAEVPAPAEETTEQSQASAEVPAPARETVTQPLAFAPASVHETVLISQDPPAEPETPAAAPADSDPEHPAETDEAAQTAPVLQDVQSDRITETVLSSVQPEGKAEEDENGEPVPPVAALPAAAPAPAAPGASGATATQVPYLQKLINDAMANTLKGRVLVVLEKNVTYEGDVEIKADGKSVSDDFQLVIQPEDAGTDGVSGNGYTSIKGNLTIRGLEVIMNSIVMAADSWIKVLNAGATSGNDASRGGSLIFNGTTNYNTTVAVDVGMNSSAELNFDDTNDKISLKTESGADYAIVNAGDGTNTINAEIAGGDVTILSGNNVDMLDVTMTGQKIGDVTIDAGGAIDEINVIYDGAPVEEKTVQVNTGDGDDWLNLDIRENAGDITIDTGLGSDTVNVAKGNHHAFETVDYNFVHNPDEKFRAEASTSTVTFVNSDDMAYDRFTIDANTAGSVNKIVFKGGKGASIYLKGLLKTDPQDGTDHRPMRWVNGDIQMDAQLFSSMGAAEMDLPLTLSWQKTAENGKELPVYNFTDALKNKHTEYLYAMLRSNNSTPYKDWAFNVDGEDFTNYVMRTPVNELDSITVDVGSKPLTLSNLVIDTDLTYDNYQDENLSDDNMFLALGGYLDVPDIDAANMNVLLRGNTVQLKSGRHISAQNVRIEAISGTKTVGQAFENLTRKRDDGDTYEGIARDIGVGIGETITDLFSVYDRAKINMNGTINATHNIEMFAKVKQFGNILGLWPSFLNVFNVKIGLAEIEIGDSARLTAQDNVYADTKIETITGIDYEDDPENPGQKRQAKSGSPIALTVVVNNSEVSVADKAEIKGTTGDVRLNAESKVTTGDYAVLGAFSSPFALASAWIFNYATTEVNGIVNAGREVEARARANTKAESEVLQSPEYKSGSGYFGALNVIDQEAKAVYSNRAVAVAGQDVRADSRAVADVDALATAGGMEPSESSPVATSFGELFALLKPAIMDKLGLDFKENRFQTAVAQMTAGGYEVKLINPSAEEEEKGSASVSTYVDKTQVLKKDYVRAIVEIEPNEGYEVDSVLYRYMEPGADHYTYAKASKVKIQSKTIAGESSNKITYSIKPSTSYTEVIVTYKKKDGSEELDKLIEELQKENLAAIARLDKLIENAVNGVDDDDQNNDEFQEIKAEDVIPANQHDLVFDSKGGGKILTWLTGKDRKNLQTGQIGQKIRLVPNPEANKKLESLSFTYTNKDNLVATVLITADKKGIYSFTVPEDIKDDEKITIQAAFGDGDGEEQAPNYKQTTGSVALTWIMNDSTAGVLDMAEVVAGRDVDLISLKSTDINTVADGTKVTDNTKVSDKQELQEKLFEQKAKYQVGEALYAIQLTSNAKDAVTGTISRKDGANALMPIFTITPPEGADISGTRVVLSYYSEMETNYFGGTLRSTEFDGSDFTKNSDGTYTLKANLNDTTIFNGDVMNVSFLFVDADGNPLKDTTGGNPTYLIRNPIATQINELRQRGSDGKYDPETASSVGELTFVQTEQRDGHTVYTFNLIKQDKASGEDKYRGYTIDDSFDLNGLSNQDVLFAAWYDTTGEKQTAPLYHITGEGSKWYFDPENPNYSIPEGAQITIVAVFSEDTRKLVEDKPKDEKGKEINNGTVKFSQNEAKYGDKVTVKLTPKDDTLVPAFLVLNWVSGEPGGGKKTMEVHEKNEKGEFVFTMPWVTESDVLEIQPRFSSKDVALTVGSNIKLSEKTGKGYGGEVITVSPSDSKAKEGKKITKINVTFTYENGTSLTKTFNSDKFTIPENNGAAQNPSPIKSVIVSAELGNKKFQIEGYAGINGKLVPVSGWADPGDKVQVRVEAEKGYRVKFGTLKAQVRTATSSGEYKLKRVEPNLYEFTLPSYDNIQSVTFTVEFEAGTDDVERSMGISVAGTLAMDDNSVEIDDGTFVVTGRNLNMTGLANGNKATTEAYAGFSSGISGFAGGVAVQGAFFNNDVRIRKNALLWIGRDNPEGGDLYMLAKSAGSFKVTGNASGNRDDKKEETGSGVGTGIAFAVNKITDKAIVEDKALLINIGNERSNIRNITINANHKTKDTVKAVAGAAGGTSTVPVVAVDYFVADAKAELGYFWKAQVAEVGSRSRGRSIEADPFELDTAGKVTVKAKSEPAQVQYNHDVTADAKSKGTTAAKGIALLVTWVTSDVDAILNQSVNAGDNVTVSSFSGDTLKATSNASAAGGYKGKKQKNGKGSADNQANGILGNAANVAGQYGGENAANVKNVANNRQLAETSETTATGAGAFILNIHKNQSKAEIKDGVNVITAKKLTVQSSNRTEAKLKANASATKSTTGTGVGVAINIVTMDNIARIGTGEIKAAQLILEAKIGETPPSVRVFKMAENSSTMQSELEARLEELIRDLVGDKVYETLGSGVSKFISTFWAGLVRDLNLQQLMDLRDDKGLAGLYSVFDTMKDRVLNFPETLAKPYIDLFNQVKDSFTDINVDNLGSFLLSELTTQAPAKAYQAFIKTFIGESGSAMFAGLVDMITKKIKKEEGGKDSLQAKIKAAGEKAFMVFVNSIYDDFMVKLEAQFPMINSNNRAMMVKLVKDLKNLTLKQLGTNLFTQFTDIFRKEIYDYEPVVTQIQDKGFTQYIKDEVLKLLKESTAALTNEVLDSIAGKLDIQMNREPTGDRHVITTQAIAGAGAAGTSNAGSIAVAVANLTTKAVIAKSEKAVTVENEGALIINAEELRRIRTHATAAVDARTGEADNNDGVGETENQNNGGSATGLQTITSEDGIITVQTEVGGKSRFSDNGTDLYIEELQEGYKMKVTRSYTLDGGVNIVENVEPEAYGDDFYVQPMAGLDATQLEDGTQVIVDVTFEEVLRDIPAVTVFNMGGDDNAYGEHGGKITLGVTGSEKFDTTAKAKTGDMVEIHIKKVNGLVPENIRVYDQAMEHPLREYDADEEENVTIRAAAENSEEYVFVFKMPPEGEEIYRINVNFKGQYDPNAPEQPSEIKDNAGRNVGRGLAFAWTWGNSEVGAEIGTRGTGTVAGVTAGSVSVTAYSEHEEENFSTAGADPFEGTSSVKDAGTDVSLSLNMLDNDIYARIAKNTKVVTNGTPGDTEETEETEIKERDLTASAGDLLIHATEFSKNEARASAFAAGSESAIGASVAANISRSSIDTELGGDAAVTGGAVIRSFSETQDRTWSFASSMGGDVQRALNKAADISDTVSKTASGVADGSVYSEIAKKNDEKKNTKTSNKIADRLNQDQAEGGQAAAGNLAVGNNIARVLNVEADNAEDADGDEGRGRAEQLIADNGDLKAPTEKINQKNQKMQAAAAIGFTLTKHYARVKVGGSVSAAKDIDITSVNASNFNTRSTAAAITMEDMGKGKSISAAIGVSVNKNKATIDVGEEPDKDGNFRKADLISASGDVTVDAEMTQNLTDVFRGYLAVQSISGAVSGKNASGSIAGSVSLVISSAETAARIRSRETKLEGDGITVHAVDKSKLSARAGAVSVSKGASVGMGISAALIWSGNTVEATLADQSTVTANSFDLTAQKKKVTFDDYKFPLKLTDLISDTSELNDEQRQNVKTGLIDIHREPGKQSYKVDLNINAYTLMQLPDMWNFLASQNYYTETIAGSVISGGMDNNLNAAGSFSVVRANNKVNAVLGDSVTIKRKTEGRTDGTVNVSARGDTTVRLLSGAVAVGAAKASAGVTVTFLYDKDDIRNTIGEGLKIEDAGDVSLTAKGGADVDTFNAAVAAGTSYNAKLTMGGGLNILLLKNKANLSVGKNSDVSANGKLDITADSDMDLKLISVNAAGSKVGAAVGGTIAFVFDEAEAKVKMGANQMLSAAGDVTLRGKASDSVLSILTSASGSKTGSAVAGVLNVLYSGTKGEVELDAGTGGITSTGGSISMIGKTDTQAINITLAGAGSASGNGVGMSVNLNIFDRTSKVNVGGSSSYSINAAKDFLSVASGDDTSVMASLAVTGGTGIMVSGNAAVIVGKNKISNTMGAGTVKAGGEAAVTSHLRDRAYAVEGNVAVSVGGSGIGGAYMFMLKENQVETDLGTTTVTAAGRAGTLAKKVPGVKDFEGLYVGARVQDTIVAVAAGVVYGTELGVTANVMNVNNNNVVQVLAHNASLNAQTLKEDGETTGEGGSVNVEATNDSSYVMIAGGVNASAAIAGGAGYVTLYAAKSVLAKVGSMKADRNVSVNATNKENIVQLNINAGGGGTAAVEVGISLQVLKSTAKAIAAGDIRAEYGDFTLESHNDVDIVNATISGGGAGVAAVTPVVVLQFFSGKSEAELRSGTVWAAKKVAVTATSDKTIDQFSIGVAGSVFASVSGGITLQFLKDSTEALVGEDTEIERAERMEINAHSNYSLLGVSGLAAGAAGAGVAVNVMLTFMKARTLAEMEGTATLVGGPLEVRAASNRSILDIGATAAGGAVGVGVTVVGLVAGTKMDQDEADMLVYGNTEKKDSTTFSASGIAKLIKDKRKEMGIKESHLSTAEIEGIDADIEGNGNHNSEMNIGTDGNFDAKGAAVDDSVYEQRGEVDEKATDGNNEDDTTPIKDNMEDKELGENKTPDETTDLKNAKALGGSVHKNAPDDIVSARIGAKAVINRSKGVTVEALQGTEADIIGGTIAFGMLGGSASGAAFAVLHSNVSASSMGELKDMGGAEVRVQAVSAGGKVSQSAEGFTHSKAEALAGGFSSDYNEKNRNEAIDAQLHQGDKSDADRNEEDIQGGRTMTDKEELDDNRQDDVQIDRAGLRVIGISVGVTGEMADAAADNDSGGGLLLGIIRSDNVTQAVLGNAVENAKQVNVSATADYKSITAFTFGVHASLAPATKVSIAAATSEGSVKAALDQTAAITGEGTDVSLTSDSDTNVYTFAAAIAGSAGSGKDLKPSKAGGLSIAINKLNQATTVEQGAAIEAEGGSVTLQADSDTTAHAYIISGVGSTQFALGLNGAITYVRPTIETTIGVVEGAKDEDADAEEEGDSGDEGGEDEDEDLDDEEDEEEDVTPVWLSGLKNVSVKNCVTSDADAGVLSINVGLGGSFQGNVLLVFNETKALAKVANSVVDVENMTVKSDLGAEGDSKMLAVTAGTGAIGVSVSYVDVNSRSNAEIDTTNLRGTIRDTLIVESGTDEEKKTKALALAVAAQVAQNFTVGLNVAVARNRAENNATILGTRSVNAANINVNAKANGTARTRMYGLSLAMGATIAGTAEGIQNEATSRATVRLSEGTVNGNLNISSQTQGTTKGYMLTGSGSLVGVTANVVAAYGRTRSIVEVETAEAPEDKVSINAVNTGNQDKVDVDINNLNLNEYSIVTIVGLGYSQDVYHTSLRLGGAWQLDSLKAETEYDTDTDVYVSPSAGGLQMHVAEINVNVAKAKNTVYAGTEVEFAKQLLRREATDEEKAEAALAENVEVKIDGNLDIQTHGKAKTTADIRTAMAVLGGGMIGVSVAHSNMSARQSAMLYLNGVNLTAGGELKVRSIADGAEAISHVGSTGVEDEADGVKAELVDVGVSSAKSWENLDSTAGILGTGKANDSIDAARLDINAENASGVTTRAFARTTNGVELMLVSGGALLAQAISGDSYNAMLSGVKATVSGKAYLTAKTNTLASATGQAPGGLTGVKVNYTEMKAYLGDKDDRQTAKVLIGDDTDLITTGENSDVYLQAENRGEAKTEMDGGVNLVIVLAIQVSKMPTSSYYDTAVLIGRDSEINSAGKASVTSTTRAVANSEMEAKTFVGGINAQHMEGKNTIRDKNQITLGLNSHIISARDLLIKGVSNTQSVATSDFDGGAILGAGQRLIAHNTVERDVIINIRDGAKIESTKGKVNIESITGEEDWILTAATIDAGAVLFDLSIANVEVSLTSNNEIHIGSGVQIDSAGDMNIIARASSKQAPGLFLPEEYGDIGDAAIYAYTKVNAGALIIPTYATTEVKLILNSMISINRDASGAEAKSALKSNAGNLNIMVSNNDFSIKAEGIADAGGGGGNTTGTAIIDTDIQNTIWADDAELSATKVQLLAGSEEGNDTKAPRFVTYARSELDALGGSADSHSNITGRYTNQIRTNNALFVNANAELFRHEAFLATNVASVDQTAKVDGPIIGSEVKEKAFDWNSTARYRCDFCLKGSSVDVGYRNLGDDLESSFSKALEPVEEINREAEEARISRERYGEEENAESGKLYILEVASPLEEDVLLTKEQMEKAQMWVNTRTFQTLTLLPNATRLYLDSAMRLQFIGEVLQGDVLNNGGCYPVDVITALTKQAMSDPLLSVGSGGSLDFRTGELTIPSLADFELYLHEISGRWLLAQLQDGLLRRMTADPKAINAGILNGGKLPEGIPDSTLTEGRPGDVFPNGEPADNAEGTWILYWLGRTPETAESREEVLVFLLLNTETDEIRAFRTSADMIGNGTEPVAVSLYLFRDFKADRNGEETYNVFFYDTPEGEKSLVKVITAVPGSETNETPKRLAILLRGMQLEGADFPAYSLTDHFFVLCDGTDGEVSMFGGFYTAEIRDDVFESAYVRIEGISSQDPKVTLKKGQDIWPEWTGERTGEDASGKKYQQVPDDEADGENPWKWVLVEPAMNTLQIANAG